MTQPKKILIATKVPFWKRVTGSQNRIYTLADSLSKYFNLTIFYFGNFSAPKDFGIKSTFVTPPFKYMVKNYFDQKKKTIFKKMSHLFPNIFSPPQKGNPYKSFIDENLASFFCTFCNSSKFDVILIEYIKFTFLIDCLERSDKTMLILDTHDIQYRRNESFNMIGKTPNFIIDKKEEISLMKRYDHIITIQKNDQKIIDEILPGRSVLAMHPHDTINTTRTDFKNSSLLRLCFFAGHQDHNLDALKWFIQKVWNRQLQQDFTLNIYGSITNTSYCRQIKTVNGVYMHGIVANPCDAFTNSDIAINPIQSGSGLKIKNIEAIANGVPLITTTVGLEGLEKGTCKFIIKADTSSEYKDSLILLKDHQKREKMSLAAIEYAEKNLSAKVCFNDLINLIANHQSI